MPRKTSHKRNVFLYIIAAVTLILLAISAYFVFLEPVETRGIDVSFIVAKNLGFDINVSSLTFGKAPPGSVSIREIDINNNRDYPVKILFSMSRNLENLLFLEPNVTIMPYKEIHFPVSLKIPEDMPYGNYFGKLILKVYKAE